MSASRVFFATLFASAIALVGCSSGNDDPGELGSTTAMTKSTADASTPKPTSTSTKDAGAPDTYVAPLLDLDAGVDAASNENVDANEAAPQVDSGPKPLVAKGSDWIWFDDDVNFTQQNAGQSPDKMPPNNWKAPIDYYDGEVEVRLDVKSKEDTTPVWLELCMWTGSLGASTHTCFHCLDLFTTPGLYTCSLTPNSQAGLADFTMPFAAMQHRSKDGTNGRGTDLQNEMKGLPIDTHYTIILVPKGDTFSGWDAYFPGTDAGK
jgi:hypothetical protein